MLQETRLEQASQGRVPQRGLGTPETNILVTHARHFIDVKRVLARDHHAQQQRCRKREPPTAYHDVHPPCMASILERHLRSSLRRSSVSFLGRSPARLCSSRGSSDRSKNSSARSP